MIHRLRNVTKFKPRWELPPVRTCWKSSPSTLLLLSRLIGKGFFRPGYFFPLQILHHTGGKADKTQLSSVLVIPAWWETGWSTMLGCLTMWLPTRWWYTSTASEVDNSLKTGSPRKTASDRSALVDIQRVRHPVAKGGRWKTFGYSTTCTWAVSNSCCLVELGLEPIDIPRHTYLTNTMALNDCSFTSYLTTISSISWKGKLRNYISANIGIFFTSY